MSMVSTSSYSGSDGGVVVISLDRTDVSNALSQDLCADLRDALVTVGPKARAIVLCSSARHFCVGADLQERRQLDPGALLEARAVSVVLTQTLLKHPLPVVAAVHGFALGGGLELALAADVIVADASAVLALPETSIGIVPGAGGTQLLARRVGWGAASEMALTGRRVAAEEAHALRLVDHLVIEGEALQCAGELAERIAANCPSSARLVKRATREGWGLPLPEALEIEDVAWRQAASSLEYREGLAAFAEKRLPTWARHDSAS